MPNSQTNNFIILATPAPVSNRTAEENLGLGYLAAVLRQNNYTVKIIDGWLENLSSKQLAQKILSEDTPLFIGFSAYQSNIERTNGIVRIIKKSADIPCVIGGFGSTEIPYIRDTLCALFPNAKVSSGDKLSSVGLGLAFDAQRRFSKTR